MNHINNITSSDPEKILIILADSTGHTAENVVKAGRYQYFRRAEIKIFPEIQTVIDLMMALSSIEAAYPPPLLGAVFTSFVSPETQDMEGLTIAFAEAKGVPYLPIISPVVDVLEKVLGEKPKRIPGFMNAVQFAKNHDDGSGEFDTLKEAKIIFIGVSRTGKTPLCHYIAAQHGLRVANYPYIAGMGIPQKYIDAEKNGSLIIVLKRDVENLLSLREERAKSERMGIYGRDYTDIEKINEEQDSLLRIAQQRRWRDIQCTHISHEEIARKAIKLYQEHRRNLANRIFFQHTPVR
jgi:hypothetical protein